MEIKLKVCIFRLFPYFGESVGESLSLAQLAVIVDVLGLAVLSLCWHDFLLKPRRQVGAPALA